VIRFRQLPQLTNTAASNTIWRAGSVNVADSAWHHLVVTYDNSSHAAGVSIYEDGTLDPAPATVADNLIATTLSTAALTIASRAAASQRLPGRIDDVAVYPAALNAAGVAVHATAGRSDIAAVTTTYYPATPPANTCAGAAVAGLAPQTNDADPAGASPAARVAHQAVYDTLGRTTGHQVLGDAHWSCTGYDTRGRPATGTDSAGHTITNDYHDATTPGGRHPVLHRLRRRRPHRHRGHRPAGAAPPATPTSKGEPPPPPTRRWAA
jgi:hypothetical protein